MKQLIKPALILALAMPLLASAQDMAREEDAFLKSMPPGIQSMQERAVRYAMAGDVDDLIAVRNSRNVAAPLPLGVNSLDIDSIYRLYTPAVRDNRKLPLLIYLHGGGWCFGSINSCSKFCGELVADGNIAVLAVDYPLAPEHPFPAPLDCCVDAVRFAFANSDKFGFDTERISIGGDSAGGNLALSTALYLSSQQDNSLASILLFYPVVKAWNDNSDSWNKYCRGYGLDGSIMEAFNHAYVAKADARNYLISPYCAPADLLRTLPPVMIINAQHDILHDQGADMERLLSENGVNVKREVFPGTSHLFITVAGQETARRRAVELSRSFLLE